MNYEELVVELTRIKDELADVRASAEVDDTTILLLHTYLRSASVNLISILYFLEYKIKERKVVRNELLDTYSCRYNC